MVQAGIQVEGPVSNTFASIADHGVFSEDVAARMERLVTLLKEYKVAAQKFMFLQHDRVGGSKAKADDEGILHERRQVNKALFEALTLLEELQERILAEKERIEALANDPRNFIQEGVEGASKAA